MAVGESAWDAFKIQIAAKMDASLEVSKKR
jgi:hypothetical protein